MPAVAAAPGIVFQFADPPRSEPELRTDIAGFVGIAERGPFHRAVRLESWHQFESVFGSFSAPAFLPLAVHAFFANGGITCYVVRVLDPDKARHALVELPIADGTSSGRTLRIIATSPGAWGNGIELECRPLPGRRFTLVVRSRDGTTWRLADCSLDPCATRYLPDVMAATAGLPIRLSSVHTGAPNEEKAIRSPDRREVTVPAPCPLENIDALAAHSVVLAGGVDGIAGLTVPHLCGREDGTDGSDRWGLMALLDVDDVSLVAMPDAVAFPRDALLPRREVAEPGCEVLRWEPPVRPSPRPETPRELVPAWTGEQTWEMALRTIRFCLLRRDCVALLDVPAEARTADQVIRYRDQSRFDTSYAGLYWPWILVDRSPRESRVRFAVAPHRDFGRLEAPALDRASGQLIYMPPSGLVAGLTAAADLLAGPHRAPAGQTGVEAINVRTPVTDDEHGSLNARGINVLRERVGRGVVLEGARSLDKRQSPRWPWRHLNVRRVLIAIAEFLDERCQDTVFEPNNERLWTELRDLIRGFLTNRWRRGWLSGATPDDAFVVHCDRDTNPPESVDLGRVVANIALRFPPPIEWVVVRIGRTAAGVQVLDEDKA